MDTGRRLVSYYSALPIKVDDDVVAIAYVVRDTGQITRAIRVMVHKQRMTLFMAVIFAALVSVILAQTMTWRLRKLS